MRTQILFNILALILFFSACNSSKENEKTTKENSIQTSELVEKKIENANYNSKNNVTFVELGSVNCIPCKKMQPVMKAIEEKYGSQIKVVFYDVWKADQKKYAEQYKIKLIPTQIFLDKEGKEFFRHEGFFSESEIDKILLEKGLKINGEG